METKACVYIDIFTLQDSICATVSVAALRQHIPPLLAFLHPHPSRIESFFVVSIRFLIA
jgi:hypothetical protein